MQKRHTNISKVLRSLVMIVFIMFFAIFVYEESVIADRESASIYVSNSVYTEQVHADFAPLYSRKRSHPWRPWFPWFPWRPWWF